MESTAHSNPPRLNTDAVSSFDKSANGRNYGIVLGVLTVIYLVIINLLSDGGDPEVGFGVPMGLRFAKHLLIIPVVWIAVATYAKSLPEGRAFKNEIGLLGRIGIWAALTVALGNIALFAITGNGFEQFLQEGGTFMGVMITSGFLIFETVVFVMIIGFVIMQAYKGKGSPED